MSQYKLSKEQRLEQSYMYMSNTILSLINENNSKTICFTSSLNDTSDKFLIIKSIYNKMIEENKKVLLLNTDPYTNEYKKINNTDKNDYSKDKIIKILSDDNYDVILLNVAPVRLFADAVEYCKLCDGTILIEKYLYTKYKNFEETLLKLKQNNIKIYGLITYR